MLVTFSIPHLPSLLDPTEALNYEYETLLSTPRLVIEYLLMTTKHAYEDLCMYCSLCLSWVPFIQAYLLKYATGSNVSLIFGFNAPRLETQLHILMQCIAFIWLWVGSVGGLTKQ
jgi:hypothetical protein